MVKKSQSSAQNPGSQPLPSRLSLAALIIGILALPAGLMPLIGIVIALVALAVAITAVIRSGKRRTSRNTPLIALFLAILAMGLALITTKTAFDFPEECQGLADEQLSACLEKY